MKFKRLNEELTLSELYDAVEDFVYNRLEGAVDNLAIATSNEVSEYDPEYCSNHISDAGYHYLYEAASAFADDLMAYAPEAMSESFTKSELLNAVQDHYGFNKKDAADWIKKADNKTKEEIVKYFKKNAKKNFYESSSDTYNEVLADLESIEKFLHDNDFYNYDVGDYSSYPMGTSKIDFEIEGDWKHDHWLFKDLIQDWADKNNRNVFKIDSQEVGESDSDYYTAIYSVYIAKDEDAFNMLNSMRPLFAQESLKEELDTQESRYFAHELGNAISDVVYDYKDKGLSEKELRKVIDDKVSSITKRFKLQEEFYVDSEDKLSKIVDKVKSYVDEGHINKDELIDKFLDWFYLDKTFLPFIINNGFISEYDIDDIVVSESFEKSINEDVDDVVMIEVPDVIADIKETDITPKGPAIGVDTGIADMLLDLINGENDTIKDYNIFKANLDSHPEFISAIEDITNEENNHIGMLQTLLKQISPNVETIKQGEAEAEKDLCDNCEVDDFDADDSFDNGFGGIYV